MKKLLVVLFLLLFPATSQADFTDVGNSHRYAKSIATLEKENVINGYADGTLLPGKVINRAEFLKIAVLAKEGSDFAPLQEAGCFSDISGEEWFAAYVCYAANEKWVNGYPDGSFGPEKYITFGEAFTMLAKIFELPVQKYFSAEWYYQPQRYFERQKLLENVEESVDFQVNRGEMIEMIANIGMLTPEQTQSIDYENLRIAVWNQVNTERTAAGVTPLLYNMQLEKTAQEHAQAMMEQNDIFHTNPETGTTVFDRCKTYYYDQRDIGENVAMGQRNATEVMNSWMNSESHKKNILHAGYREIGIGVAQDKDGKLFWVQVFGTQCEERDAMHGCMSRAEFQERNPGKYESSFFWY